MNTDKTSLENKSQQPCLGAVSSSTDLNHKCSIEELNLFLFFFVRWENKNIEI